MIEALRLEDSSAALCSGSAVKRTAWEAIANHSPMEASIQGPISFLVRVADSGSELRVATVSTTEAFPIGTSTHLAKRHTLSYL